MTFNVDPVTASLLTFATSLLLGFWHSLKRMVMTKHSEALQKMDEHYEAARERQDDLHSQNIERMDHMETELTKRLDGHGAMIGDLQQKVSVIQGRLERG